MFNEKFLSRTFCKIKEKKLEYRSIYELIFIHILIIDCNWVILPRWSVPPIFHRLTLPSESDWSEGSQSLSSSSKAPSNMHIFITIISSLLIISTNDLDDFNTLGNDASNFDFPIVSLPGMSSPILLRCLLSRS